MQNAIVVTDLNRGLFGGLVHEQFRQRHDLFVKELGWDIPRTETIETDQYDRADTTYVLVEEGGNLVAYARLIPTSSRVQYGKEEISYMVRDAALGRLEGIPSNLTDIELPNSPDVWEMTRVEARDRTSLVKMFDTSADWLRAQGAKSTITFTRRVFAPILTRLGYPTTPQGPDVSYGAKPYCVLTTDLSTPNNDIAHPELERLPDPERATQSA